MNWAPIIETLKRYETFVISSHIGIEGDALGSEIAVARLLHNMGKRSTIINHDPVPVSLEYLVNGNTVLRADDPRSKDIVRACDAVVVVDVSNWDHLGRTADLLMECGKPLVCIDHHKSAKPIGDHSVIDSTAASTGVLIYDMACRFPEHLFDVEVATSIYTTILTDTGNFRFSNTNAKAYTVAADLLSRGVDHAAVCKELYQNDSWGRYRLMYLVLGTLHKEAGGKIAWMKLDKQMCKDADATYADSEGFVDMARCIRGVEVSVLVREINAGTTKVTMRSKEYVDVQMIASIFGGGGHARASGAVVRTPMDTAVQLVVDEIKKVL